MKTIFITGASSGIGRALALVWSKQKNITLILAARNIPTLEKVSEQCRANGSQSFVVGMDLANRDSIHAVVKEIELRFPQIDIVVHNGGISQRSTVKDTSLEVFRRLMEVNFFGAVTLTQLLLPRMLSKKSGHIVVVSSVMGKLGFPLRSGYAASKHALHGFFDSLRAEVSGEGIRVTLVCPGYVKTNISMDALKADGSKHHQMDEATANGMDPADFAQKMIAAVDAGKEEVSIGGAREMLGIYLKRFFPKILSRMVSRSRVN